jgi:hypothetical protein
VQTTGTLPLTLRLAVLGAEFFKTGQCRVPGRFKGRIVNPRQHLASLDLLPQLNRALPEGTADLERQGCPLGGTHNSRETQGQVTVLSTSSPTGSPTSNPTGNLGYAYRNRRLLGLGRHVAGLAAGQQERDDRKGKNKSFESGPEAGILARGERRDLR